MMFRRQKKWLSLPKSQARNLIAIIQKFKNKQKINPSQNQGIQSQNHSIEGSSQKEVSSKLESLNVSKQTISHDYYDEPFPKSRDNKYKKYCREICQRYIRREKRRLKIQEKENLKLTQKLIKLEERDSFPQRKQGFSPFKQSHRNFKRNSFYNQNINFQIASKLKASSCHRKQPTELSIESIQRKISKMYKISLPSLDKKKKQEKSQKKLKLKKKMRSVIFSGKDLDIDGWKEKNYDLALNNFKK